MSKEELIKFLKEKIMTREEQAKRDCNYYEVIKDTVCSALIEVEDCGKR